MANKITVTAKKSVANIKRQLQKLSFRTGIVVLLSCIPFYILSFAQMALPISVKAKGILWFILFGLAKTFQYGGITILGAEGVKRLKNFIKTKRNNKTIKHHENSDKILFKDGTHGENGESR